MDLRAGSTDMLARVLDMGGTGGILVASHLFGEQMRQMIDEPDERGKIDADLADVYAALSVTTNPIPIKAALNIVGHRVGGLRLPLVEASQKEQAQLRAMLERHGMAEVVGTGERESTGLV